MDWGEIIVKFICLVWADETIEERFAKHLTVWCAEDFFPSVPRGLLNHQVNVGLARVEIFSSVQQAILELSSLNNIERANLGVRTLAGSFGLSEDELFELTAEMVRDF